MLDHIRVHDAMHQGIITCEPDTPLHDVAAIMANHACKRSRWPTARAVAGALSCRT